MDGDTEVEESIYSSSKEESIYDKGNKETSLHVARKSNSRKSGKSLRMKFEEIDEETEKEDRDNMSNSMRSVNSAYVRKLMSGSKLLPHKFGDSGKSSSVDLEKDANLHLQKEGKVPDDLMNRLWHVNYREAAIYLHEGRRNNHFQKHPKNIAALRLHLLINNPVYQIINFILSRLCIVLITLIDIIFVTRLEHS